MPGILSPTRPAVGPQILSGTGLDGPGDIVLGPATLAQLHKRVGDDVTVQLGPVIRDARLKIVGTAALPALGDTLGIHPSLATGAILPTSVVSRAALNEDGPNSGPNAIFVRLRPGVSQAAGLRSLQQIANYYNQVTHSPQIVAPGRRVGLGAAGQRAAGAASRGDRQLQVDGHDAGGPGRRGGRRRGGRPRPDAGRVGAEAAARPRAAEDARLHPQAARRHRRLAVHGGRRGRPGHRGAAGHRGGRWLWIVFARELSAVPDPVVPAASVALAAVAALVLANLVAAVPGRQAARTPAALLLRAE